MCSLFYFILLFCIIYFQMIFTPLTNIISNDPSFSSPFFLSSSSLSSSSLSSSSLSSSLSSFPSFFLSPSLSPSPSPSPSSLSSSSLPHPHHPQPSPTQWCLTLVLEWVPLSVADLIADCVRRRTVVPTPWVKVGDERMNE